MSHKEMALVLKAVCALACIACILVAGAVVPQVEARAVIPAGSVVAFVVGIAPLLVAGVVAWRLFSAIGRGQTFVTENVGRLRCVAICAAADAGVWFVLIALYALVSQPPALSVVAALLVAMVFAVCLAAVAAALSHLTAKAVELQQENDLVV